MIVFVVEFDLVFVMILVFFVIVFWIIWNSWYFFFYVKLGDLFVVLYIINEFVLFFVNYIDNFFVFL